MSKFSIRFKDLRQNMQLTQDELSNKLGISRSTIGMYETGKREPDYDSLTDIADYFNVDIGYLLGTQDVTHLAKGISSSEQKLLETARELNDEGQEVLIDYASFLANQDKYKKSNQPELVEENA